MKNCFVCLVVVVMVLTGCGSSSSPSSAPADTIKLGANLELSGDLANYGNNGREGIEFAVEQINASGGVKGRALEVIYIDNRSNTTESVSVAQNLLSRKDVVAIVGGTTSGTTKSMITYAQKAKVPIVTPTGTSDELTFFDGKVQEYVYRACFQDSFQGVVISDYVTETMKAEKVFLYGDNSQEYTKGLIDAFNEAYSGEITATEYFAAGDKDFRTVLTKMKDKDFDVIVIPAYYTEAGMIIKQAREMGITQPIIGGDGFGDPVLTETAGPENTVDVYYADHYSNSAPTSEATANFISSYKKKYGKSPAAYTALAYDAVYMIKQAIEDTGKATPASINEGLAQLEDFVGVSGTMTMGQDHNPIKPAVVVELEGGKEVGAEIVNP